MKRSRENSVIPGFYRDPKTGRYFKIRASSLPLPILPNGSSTSADLNTSGRKIVNEHTVPRRKSILNILSDNQMGSTGSLSYQYEVSTLRLENLNLAGRYVYPEPNKGLKIRLLRGGIKYLYAQWVSPRKGTFFYAFGDFTDLNLTPEPEAHRYQIAYIAPQTIVADMCESFMRPLCLLYVGNDCHSGLGTAQLVWRRENSDETYDMSEHFCINSAVWCCSNNRFSRLFALGVENGVYVHNYNTHLFTRKVKGQVLGIYFEKKGDIIYAGVNHGELITVDTRVSNPVCTTKLNEYALTEISLLDNNNYMLCAGLGNFLAQVDLRMQRKVVNYLGEFRNTLKSPFSFNEACNILCSTGSDNITRLWNLRGGNPLMTVPPPFKGENCQSWLLDNVSLKVSLYIASKNMVYVYEC